MAPGPVHPDPTSNSHPTPHPYPHLHPPPYPVSPPMPHPHPHPQRGLQSHPHPDRHRHRHADTYPPRVHSNDQQMANGEWQVVVPRRRRRQNRYCNTPQVPPYTLGNRSRGPHTHTHRHVTHHRGPAGQIRLGPRAPLSFPPPMVSAPSNCSCTCYLPPHSAGYKFAAAAVRASMDRIFIVCVQEVNNAKLTRRFDAFYEGQRPHGVMLWGFHGTGCECCRGGYKAVANIPQTGFIPGKDGNIYVSAKALYVDLGFASKTPDGKHHQMLLCQMYVAPRNVGGWECCNFCWNHGPTATVSSADAILPRYVVTYNCGH